MRGIKTSATILVVRRLSKKGKRSKIKYRNSETMKLFAKGAICNATAGCMFPVTWKPQRAFCLIRICHSYTWLLRFVVNQHIKNQILLWTLVLYHYREKKNSTSLIQKQTQRRSSIIKWSQTFRFHSSCCYARSLQRVRIGCQKNALLKRYFAQEKQLCRRCVK